MSLATGFRWSSGHFLTSVSGWELKPCFRPLWAKATRDPEDRKGLKREVMFAAESYRTEE